MSNQQHVIVEGSEGKVNDWLKNQSWLIQYSWDRQFADEIKQGLALWTPPADMNNDPSHAAWEANIRAALAQIISELDRNNLQPLFHAARALALFPITFEGEES